MPTLVICQRGNVRSVTVATVLKDLIGLQDVIAVGMETTSTQAMDMLVTWADKVIIAGEVDLLGGMLVAHAKVVILHEVGKDIWGQAMHPELVKLVLDGLERIGYPMTGGPFYHSKETYLSAVESVYANGCNVRYGKLNADNGIASN